MSDPTSCMNWKSIKWRKHDVVVAPFHCCYNSVTPVCPKTPLEEFLNISVPDLVPPPFHKHYDTITELPEHHLVSIDKHMPRRWNQTFWGNGRWCQANNRWGDLCMSLHHHSWMCHQVLYSCFSACVSVWLVDHLLHYHLYTLKHSLAPSLILTTAHTNWEERGLVRGGN